MLRAQKPIRKIAAAQRDATLRIRIDESKTRLTIRRPQVVKHRPRV